MTARELSVGTLVLLVLLLPHGSFGTIPDAADVRTVAGNWTRSVARRTGGWSGRSIPEVRTPGPLVSKDGRTLAYAFPVDPDGFVVVTALRELPPVKLYSETGTFDVESTRGLVQLVRERLDAQFSIFVDRYGRLDVSPPARDETFPTHHRDTWDRLSVAPAVFETRMERGMEPPLRGTGPLLSTNWHQQYPYNADCPMGDGGRCLVGCVATGTAQVMNYHAWPPHGFGRHTYWWNGDGSVPGDSLSADFSDAYDWSGSSTGLAEICYEVGVAYEMNYGHDASYASLSSGPYVLRSYFRYDDSMSYEDGADYTSNEWFQLIQSEIGSDRPMPYGYPGHALACDGWRVDGSEHQIHLNYGWGGSMNGWYAVDDIYGHSGSHTSEHLIKNMVPDPAIILNAAGTGDYPTIQAAIDAASSGEIIKLQDGVYTGQGNRDVSFRGKAVTVRSQSRDPDVCTVNAQGTPLDEHRCFLFVSGEGPASRLEDIRLRGGWASDGGAAIACYGSSPTIEGCLVIDNTSPYGAAVGCYEASPTITNCTIYGNHGGALAAVAASPDVQQTIITANTDTFAVVCLEGGLPQFACTDIWGNPEGDWTECIEHQQTMNGNLSVDPLFCAEWDTVLTLSSPSECLPDNNACGVLMGAYDEGCSNYFVYPDGTGYFPTIQSAVDAAVDGATIRLADGVFSGPGNRDVNVIGKWVNIRSVSENPTSCVIDCSDEGRAAHRALTYRSSRWPACQIVGVTLTGGYQPSGNGGAVLVGDSGSVYMRDCVLAENEAARGGAAAADSSSQLQFHYCELSGNSAGEGGALWSRNAQLALTVCTVAENQAEVGSGISISGGSLGVMSSIIAFGGPGEAVAGSAVAPEFDCSDVFGNQGGDWIGCIAGQNGVDGNRSNDPLFCNAPAGDYTIAEDSPCLDLTGCLFSVSPQIGCYGVGCTQAGVPDGPPEPGAVELLQNTPNPFNPATTIRYTLPEDGRVTLAVYDIVGRLVSTLVDGETPAGRHSVVWNGTDECGHRVASGVYFARLRCDDAVQVSKLVIVK
ncbi:MAG: T9SS type A sorting domain-containing protein [Candidatus Eisenbacteria bacterium]|nr:T9SS type A sorting domain-containing protein [Candidatus Eisenbacteria bacterium]